jgi:hypothetical protein
MGRRPFNGALILKIKIKCHLYFRLKSFYKPYLNKYYKYDFILSFKNLKIFVFNKLNNPFLKDINK